MDTKMKIKGDAGATPVGDQGANPLHGSAPGDRLAEAFGYRSDEAGAATEPPGGQPVASITSACRRALRRD